MLFAAEDRGRGRTGEHKYERTKNRKPGLRGVRAFGFSEPCDARGRCAGACRCSCDYLPQEAQEPPPAGVPSRASAAETEPNSFAACSRCGRRPSERAFRITSRTTVDAEVDSWAQSCMNASRSSIERRTLRTVDLTVMVTVFSETSLWGTTDRNAMMGKSNCGIFPIYTNVTCLVSGFEQNPFEFQRIRTQKYFQIRIEILFLSRSKFRFFSSISTFFCSSTSEIEIDILDFVNPRVDFCTFRITSILFPRQFRRLHRLKRPKPKHRRQNRALRSGQGFNRPLPGISGKSSSTRGRVLETKTRPYSGNPSAGRRRQSGPTSKARRTVGRFRSIRNAPGILIYGDPRARCLARKTLCRDFLPDREEWISGRQSKKGGRAKRTSWFMRKRSTSKKEAGEEASRTRAAQNSSISFARNCDRVEKIRRTASSSEILTPTERIIARIHRSPGSRSVR